MTNSGGHQMEFYQIKLSEAVLEITPIRTRRFARI